MMERQLLSKAEGRQIFCKAVEVKLTARTDEEVQRKWAAF